MYLESTNYCTNLEKIWKYTKLDNSNRVLSKLLIRESSNDIGGIIYRHPKMDTNLFIDEKPNQKY